jgi:hypothetical protein
LGKRFSVVTDDELVLVRKAMEGGSNVKNALRELGYRDFRKETIMAVRTAMAEKFGTDTMQEIYKKRKGHICHLRFWFIQRVQTADTMDTIDQIIGILEYILGLAHIKREELQQKDN